MPADINVISPQNSLSLPLGLNPSQTFTGTFVDVTDFTSITSIVDASGPGSFEGYVFQWSENGTTVAYEQKFSDSSGRSVFSASVKAQYFRVKYTADTFGHTYTFIQTLLRRGTPAGSIGRAGMAISQGYDAQIVNAVLTAARNDNPSDLVFPRASNDPFLIITHPPARPTLIAQAITATSSSSPQFDFFGIFGATRRFFTVFNNTTRGDLFLKYGGVASVAPTGYNYRIPPQGTWTMPFSWIPYSGTVYGIWDDASQGGEAHVLEGF